jgi:murein DD-endopeptidase MepM/ murein hydrolase activator NlpD
VKYSSNLALKFGKRPILTLLLSVAILVTPLSLAHAGVLSFLEDIFDRTKIVFYKKELNSQNMALLQAAVNPDPNPSKGGGGISIVEGSALLPEASPLGTSADLDSQDRPQSDQISVYVVRGGDSVSQIAEMFEVSAKTIMWANDLNSKGTIQPGQTLVILPVSGVQHSVAKGETLASIAKKFDGEITEIMEFNGFEEGHVLSIGDEIIVPGGEMQIEPPKSSGSRSYASSVVNVSNSGSYAGYYMRPVNGGVRSQGIHGYNAIDIAASPGTPILASADGKVILSKYAPGNPWFGGYGNYIVVQHANGTQTVYAHLSGNLVKRGWSVVQGQVIGYMGSTGRSTGTHLHFEIRNGIKNPF